MNKQLIKIMAKEIRSRGITSNSDGYILITETIATEAALKAINDAGFVVVPKEPTEAMLNASGCECGMGAPEGYGDPNELYIANDYKAMIQAAQEDPEE